MPNRFKPEAVEAQDIEQRWFPGVHSDIGGGYPEVESALSKRPLIWMVEEAVTAGLRITNTTLQHLAYGTADGEGDHEYVAPSPAGRLHRSLKGLWWLLEFLPKSTKKREWPQRRSLAGVYIPAAEPRLVEAEHATDASVLDREAQVAAYRPINISPRGSTGHAH